MVHRWTISFVVLFLSANIFAATVVIPPAVTETISGKNIRLNYAYINKVAEQYCRNTKKPGPLSFFLSNLALKSIDDKFITKTKQFELYGNMFLAGFLGGAWFKEVLPHHKVEKIRQNLQLFELQMMELHYPTKKTFVSFDAFITYLTKLAFSDDELQIRVANRMLRSLLFTIIGYNRGYVESLLSNPPKGVIAPWQYYQCKHKLDCYRPGLDFKALNPYLTVVTKLNSPKMRRLHWRYLRAERDFHLSFSEKLGNYIWRKRNLDVLNKSSYYLLVDISSQFVMVSEVPILAGMLNTVEHNKDAGRNALLKGALFLTWLDGYFKGITYKGSESTQAMLQCNS